MAFQLDALRSRKGKIDLLALKARTVANKDVFKGRERENGSIPNGRACLASPERNLSSVRATSVAGPLVRAKGIDLHHQVRSIAPPNAKSISSRERSLAEQDDSLYPKIADDVEMRLRLSPLAEREGASVGR